MKDKDQVTPAMPVKDSAPASRGRGASAWLASLVQHLEDGLGRFPGVAALMLVAVIAGTVLVYDVLPDESFMGRLVSYLHTACLLATPVAVATQLWGERRDKDKHPDTRLQVVAAGASAALFTGIALVGHHIQREELLTCWQVGLSLTALCLVPWLLMTRENERGLVPKLVRDVLYALLLTLVIFIGLLVCMLAAEYLLFDGNVSFERLYEVIALACWELLFVNLLCAGLPRHDSKLTSPRAYTSIVGYGLFPVCLVLLAVLYGYIGKVVVQWSLPSGQMNWFGSLALLGFVALWTGMREATSKPAQLFVRWGWALLVPVVVVQLVGIWIRVQAYGLTELRYLGLLCLGIGLAALALAAFKRSPRGLFALMAAVSLVVGITPANPFDVAFLSQSSRLVQALDEAGLLDENGLPSVGTTPVSMPEEAARRALSAWDELEERPVGYLNNPVVDALREANGGSVIEQIPVPSESEEREDAWHWSAFVPETDGIDLTGFARAYELHADTYDTDEHGIDDKNGYTLRFSWNDGTSLEVSLAELVETLASQEPSVQQNSSEDQSFTVPADELRVSCGDGRVLVITRLELQASGTTLEEMSLDGFLLVPEG